MKYTNKQWQELANKVALYNQLADEIETAKNDIRQMTDEETKNQYITIARGDNTTKKYPENYKTELKLVKSKLAQKYQEEIIETTRKNYTITLTPLKQAIQIADTIITDITPINNTKLKQMVASTITHPHKK